MFNICAYNKITNEYVHIDFVEAKDKNEALDLWKSKNPRRSEIFIKHDVLSLVALFEGGGI